MTDHAQLQYIPTDPSNSQRIFPLHWSAVLDREEPAQLQELL